MLKAFDVSSGHFEKWEKERLKSIFSGRRMTDTNFDLPLFLLTYLGIYRSKEVETRIMEMRKDFTINGYKFAVGIIDQTHYTVGLLSWSGLRDFSAEELRKYRYAMFQAQVEIGKMQNDIEDVLRQSVLGGG